MKRLHVNLSVADLEESMRFYSALFAAEPVVVKPDYAKWMLEDPRVNFAITTRGARKGIDHLGIQVENEDELGEVYAGLKSAGRPVIEQGETTCCYAQSQKNWIFDPEGIAWETFLTKGESAVYGSDADLQGGDSACCARPTADQAGAAGSCCTPDEKKAEQATGCCA